MQKNAKAEGYMGRKQMDTDKVGGVKGWKRKRVKRMGVY